jgi:hypothetical protein
VVKGVFLMLSAGVCYSRIWESIRYINIQRLSACHFQSSEFKRVSRVHKNQGSNVINSIRSRILSRYMAISLINI